MADLPNVPKLFVCPITLEIMKEPTLTFCGHMFEREAIVGWLKGNDMIKSGEGLCPICNQPVNENQLAPCFPVKNAIDDFLANQLQAYSKPKDQKFVNFSELSDQVKGQLNSNNSQKKNLVGRVRESVFNRLSRLAISKPDPPSKTGGGSTPVNQPVGTWAELRSLSRHYDSIMLTKEHFYIGRSSACDQHISRAELSSKHCHVYRVPKPNPAVDDFPYDVFIEDLSTNGTYVNGRRLGREDPAYLKHGDEISLGSRFSSQDVPDVPTFADWVFLGAMKTAPSYADVEKIKAVRSFQQLVHYVENDFQGLNLEHPEIKYKIAAAIKTWNDDHVLPAYKYLTVGNVHASPKVPETPSPSPPPQSGSQSGESSPPHSNRRAHRASTANMPAAETPQDLGGYGYDMDLRLMEVEKEGEVEYIEPLFGFTPSLYSVDAKLRQVVLTIKRNHTYGRSCIFITSTRDGTAQPGRDFNPVYNDPIVFADHSDTVSYLFRWGLGPQGLQGGWGGGDGFIQTINFVLRNADGKPVTPLENADSSAVVIIEGSGQPEPLPEPKTLEDTHYILMQKFTHLFDDVSPATISGLIEKERKASTTATKDMQQMEESIMKKILWYRDLPIEENSLKLPAELPYDQSSFRYKRPSVVSLGGEHPLSPSSNSGATPQLPDLPPLPKPKSKTVSVNLSALFNVPPPPPSIAIGSSFLTEGAILENELKPFILLACLDYLKNSPKYADILSQKHHPNASHCERLSSTVCQQVAGAVVRHLAPSAKLKSQTSFEQREVVQRILAETDKVMGNLLSLQGDKPSDPTPKISSPYEAYSTPCRPNMFSRSLVIEDVNGLFDLEEEGEPRYSLYSVIEGFGSPQAAEFVSVHLPSSITSHPSFASNAPLAIEAGFTTTGDLLMRKNLNGNIKLGAICSLLLLHGSQLYISWLGPAQAFSFKAGKTSVEDNTLAYTPFTLTQRFAGKIESLGMAPDEDMISDWLSNPEMVKQLDLTQNSAKPHITHLKMEGDEHFIVLATRTFWKALSPEAVGDLLAKQLLLKSPAPIPFAELLQAQARKADKNAPDASVAVIKISK